MSFLFLLVLSLISYVAVESRTAESRTAYSMARAHAKLGLLVAIGELQEHAGPDQRVTATATILDENPYTPKVDNVNHPYWTGVWKRDPAAPLHPPGQDSNQPWNEPPDPEWDPHPEMELTWLVSGNEGKQSSEADYLHPTSADLPDPDYSGSAVWLVNNSVSRSEERVKALRSPVQTAFYDDSSSGSDEVTGSYAYWVGDEGVKAKVDVRKTDRTLDAKKNFLENQARFEVSPGPQLGLAETPDGSLDLASMDSTMLERVVNVPELQYLAEGDENSTKPYFHHLTTDAYGVLSDVLRGGLKRDLTAGLGDSDQFEYYLQGEPIFKDPLFDGSGFKGELIGPLWDYLKDYYMLYAELDFDPYKPTESSLVPRPVHADNYPNLNDGFWSEENDRPEPETHPVTPVLMQAELGHTLEMVDAGTMGVGSVIVTNGGTGYRLKDMVFIAGGALGRVQRVGRGGAIISVQVIFPGTGYASAPIAKVASKLGKDAELSVNLVDMYRPRIAIFPSVALWNPYNVELEAAEYEFVWKPDPKFWVYATRERYQWAEDVMAAEDKHNVRLKEEDRFDPNDPLQMKKPAGWGRRWFDVNADGELSTVRWKIFIPEEKRHCGPWHDFVDVEDEEGVIKRERSCKKGARCMDHEKCLRDKCVYRNSGVLEYNNMNRQFLGFNTQGRARGIDYVRNGQIDVIFGSGKLKWGPLNAAAETWFNGHDSFPNAYYNGAYGLYSYERPFSGMRYRAFRLYRAPASNKVWNGGAKHQDSLQPLRLNITAPRMAPGEKLWFTLKASQPEELDLVSDKGIELTNKGKHEAHLYYDVPPRFCPPVPKNSYVTLVYQDGRIENVGDGANPDEIDEGATVYLIDRDGKHVIQKLYRGTGSKGSTAASSDVFQDYWLNDVRDANPARMIRLYLQARPPTARGRAIYKEHNVRALVDHQQSNRSVYWMTQKSNLKGSLADFADTDDDGDWDAIKDKGSRVEFSNNVPDQSLQCGFYGSGGRRIYYGFIGFSYHTSGFQRGKFFVPTSARATFFDVPRQPLMSLGSLQHVNLGFFSDMPSYVIGNSYATRQVVQNRKRTRRESKNLKFQHTIIDYSYLANETLWDSFFFSTVPTKDLNRNNKRMGYAYPPLEHFDQSFVDDGKPLPNPRMLYYSSDAGLAPDAEEEEGALRNFQKAAGNLVVDGAFNVNSTSVEAWKALLGGLSQSKLYIRDLKDGNELSLDGRNDTHLEFGSYEFPFPRLSVSMGEPVNPESDDVYQDFWTGFVVLNEDQLQRLAEEIVQEVKFRGPFLSLGDFVNRRLSNPRSNKKKPQGYEESRQGLRGALQAAIHDAKINDGGGVLRTAGKSYNAFGRIMGINEGDSTLKGGEAPGNMRAVRNMANGAMMPGWLNQADLLTPLASVITPRSDTFRVRAYGDAGPNYPGVRAWCEAIVQRIPEYVVDAVKYPDEGDPPHARPMEPYEDLNGNGEHDSGEPFSDYDSSRSRNESDVYGDEPLQNLDNERFGRRFRIVHFRWLPEEEI